MVYSTLMTLCHHFSFLFRHVLLPLARNTLSFFAPSYLFSIFRRYNNVSVYLDEIFLVASLPVYYNHFLIDLSRINWEHLFSRHDHFKLIDQNLNLKSLFRYILHSIFTFDRIEWRLQIAPAAATAIPYFYQQIYF